MRDVDKILADKLHEELMVSCCDECGRLVPFGKSLCEAHTKSAEKPKLHVKTPPPGPERGTPTFIKRCVDRMTSSGKKDPSKPGQLSSAFAICTAAEKKHPEASAQKEKEGISDKRLKRYEGTLTKARRARAIARAEREAEEE